MSLNSVHSCSSRVAFLGTVVVLEFSLFSSMRLNMYEVAIGGSVSILEV